MRTARRVGAVFAILVASCAHVAGAGAVERVADGSFEARTVCGTACANEAWSRTGERVSFCKTGSFCSGKASKGAYYAQFGGGTAFPDEGYPAFFLRGRFEQRIDVPAGPASLAFDYLFENSAGFAEFFVRLDGVQLFATSSPQQPVEKFVHKVFDVSSHAGVGKHDLEFEFACVNTCTRISLDEVSLDAADPPPPPQPPGSPSSPITATCRGRTATIVGAGGTLTGTPGPDVIVGSQKPETIKAKGGDDLVCAGGGPDKVHGGPGVDILLGQKGRDLLNGGPAADVLLGGPGRDAEKP
jgi:RTX calcium-binding nonapeptide repeat (4 copies)